MPWVRFTAPFDFKPPGRPQVTIAYKPGVYNVPSACATLAIAAGKAVRLPKPKMKIEVEELKNGTA